MTGRKSILGVALTSALSLAVSTAHAGDFYPGLGYKDGLYVPVAAWTGFYAGLNGGYAFDAWSSHGGVLDNGGFGGAQIGYNWQGAFGLSRMLVLGAEADFQGTDIDNTGHGTLTYPATHTVDADLHKRSIEDFGTIRGRAGYAWERTLFLSPAALPMALSEITSITLLQAMFTSPIACKPVTSSVERFEYKIAPAWSLKAEYQYIDLAADRPVGSLGGSVITRDTELNTFRGGVNFHFQLSARVFEVTGCEPLRFRNSPICELRNCWPHGLSRKNAGVPG